MPRRNLWPRLFTTGCAVLLVSVLANQMLLSADPSPSKSWDHGEAQDGHSVLAVTFQTDPGDRLSVDVGQALFQLQLREGVGPVVAALYATPEGDPGPDVAALDPQRQYEGQVVQEPRRGIFMEPEAQRWTVQGDGWWTFVVTIDHGTYRPPGGETWEDVSDVWQERLVDRSPLGPTHGPYQAIPKQALDWQPWLYLVEGLAAAAIVVGAAMVVASWTRRDEAEGLEAGVQLAEQARSWLSTLYTLLWVALLGMVGLACTILLLVSGASLDVNAGLAPDGFYPTWSQWALTGAILASLAGLGTLLWRVRNARRNVGRLRLDGPEA